MDVQQEHSTMVNKLSKDGLEIHLSLGGKDCHIWHMATGVMGEAIEAWEYTDRNNLIEELGDIEFYLNGLMQKYHADIIIPVVEQCEKGLDLLLMDIVKVSGLMLDFVKKTVVYRKDFSDEIRDCACELYHILACIYWVQGIDRDYILNHNMNKLLKNKDARYKNGSYSNEQAIIRSDKSE